MYQLIAKYCLLVSIFLVAISPFLPLFLAWRIALLSVVVYIISVLISGAQMDMGYEVGMGMTLVLLYVTLIVNGIRLVVSAMRKNLSAKTLNGPNTRLKSVLNYTVLFFGGCLTGLLLFVFLAGFLSGTSGGEKLDLSIAAFAGISAVLLLFFLDRKPSIFFFSAFVFLAVAAGMSSFQTGRILEMGETLANGRKWCLTRAATGKAIHNVEQLGFFSMVKSGGYPHIGLVVRDEGKTLLLAHWSIRQQAFVEAPYENLSVRICQPVENFLTH